MVAEHWYDMYNNFSLCTVFALKHKRPRVGTILVRDLSQAHGGCAMQQPGVYQPQYKYMYYWSEEGDQ